MITLSSRELALAQILIDTNTKLFFVRNMIFLLALIAVPKILFSDVNKWLTCFEKSDYNCALEQWHMSAVNGDGDAQLILKSLGLKTKAPSNEADCFIGGELF